MITQELLAYIKQQLALGKSKDEIRHAILAGGDWHEGEIEIAFDQVDSLNGSGVPFHKKHRLLPFLLILLALCVGGVYAWSRYRLEVQITPVVPVIEEQKTTEVKDTYTYINHGFSIELPNGFVPTEQVGQGDTTVNIVLPNNSSLSYVRDVPNWEKHELPEGSNNCSKTSELIGETTFTVYACGNSSEYWFKQGAVGYDFRGDKELLKTFKFVGWSQIEGNKEDLVSFSITPEQEVSGSLSFTGVLKQGYFFEGNFGLGLVDANKVPIKTSYDVTKHADVDYYSKTVPISGTINFATVPKGKVYIVITQDDPRDDAERGDYKIKQVFIPVIVK